MSNDLLSAMLPTTRQSVSSAGKRCPRIGHSHLKVVIAVISAVDARVLISGLAWDPTLSFRFTMDAQAEARGLCLVWKR